MLARNFRRWRGTGIGFALGLMLGVGVLVGSRFAAPARPEIPLHALATHGTDTMVICTVPIDDSNEGLATLDYLTGELRLFVMNPRTNTFTMGGKTSVLADLGIERGKKVNLLMVSGHTKYIRGGGPLAPSTSTLYVCDATTGKFVAYAMGYPPGALAAVAPTEIAIKKFDVGVTRELNLNE